MNLHSLISLCHVTLPIWWHNLVWPQNSYGFISFYTYRQKLDVESSLQGGLLIVYVAGNFCMSGFLVTIFCKMLESLKPWNHLLHGCWALKGLNLWKLNNLVSALALSLYLACAGTCADEFEVNINLRSTHLIWLSSSSIGSRKHATGIL